MRSVSIGPRPPMKPDISTLHKPDILILQRHSRFRARHVGSISATFTAPFVPFELGGFLNVQAAPSITASALSRETSAFDRRLRFVRSPFFLFLPEIFSLARPRLAS